MGRLVFEAVLEAGPVEDRPRQDVNRSGEFITELAGKRGRERRVVEVAVGERGQLASSTCRLASTSLKASVAASTSAGPLTSSGSMVRSPSPTRRAPSMSRRSGRSYVAATTRLRPTSITTRPIARARLRMAESLASSATASMRWSSAVDRLSTSSNSGWTVSKLSVNAAAMSSRSTPVANGFGVRPAVASAIGLSNAPPDALRSMVRAASFTPGSSLRPSAAIDRSNWAFDTPSFTREAPGMEEPAR